MQKRILIRKTAKQKVVVKTEICYRNDDSQKKFQSLLERGKNLNNVHFPELRISHKIKEKKIVV